MHLLHRTKHLLRYLIHAKTKYYLHSPFVYQFYLNVLEGKTSTSEIELLRSRLVNDDSLISFSDFGKKGVATKKSVREFASVSAITKKYGEVLHRASAYFKPKTTLELGTNIGLSAAYLASGNPTGKIYSVDASAELQQLARANFASLHLQNIETINGNFDDVLQEVVRELPSLDMVFFDGNHRCEPTLRYFNICAEAANEQSVFIVDDIYWNAEMTEAWQAIKKHHRVTLTIDIFRIGFVFFNPQKIAREHFMLLC